MSKRPKETIEIKENIPIDVTDLELKQAKAKRRNYIRSLIAYFILGVVNNYGYIVMLSGAHDIIYKLEEHYVVGNPRNCTEMSTGAILLADIVPTFFIKILGPFFPLCIHIRMAMCVGCSAGGFILVAFATTKWVALIGVVLTSMCCGLGETSLLQYSSFFNKNVISTWSSGTGGAGILGALSYTVLSLISIRVAMLAGLSICVMQAIAFWVILPKPDPENQQEVLKQQKKAAEQNIGRKELLKIRLRLLPGLFQYMYPLTTVYLFEYFINQAVFELIYYENIFINHGFQYKTLQILYQVGVFISRSTVNCFHIKQLWIFSILQFINLILFTCEGIFYFVPSIWIVFFFTLWEGFLGGLSYVNTYYKVYRDIQGEHKQFSIGMSSISDAIGITSAGILSIPVHNAICKLYKPSRLSF